MTPDNVSSLLFKFKAIKYYLNKNILYSMLISITLQPHIDRSYIFVIIPDCYRWHLAGFWKLRSLGCIQRGSFLPIASDWPDLVFVWQKLHSRSGIEPKKMFQPEKNYFSVLLTEVKSVPKKRIVKIIFGRQAVSLL